MPTTHQEPFIHPSALIEPDVEIHSESQVGAWTHLFSGVRIGCQCQVGDHCTLEKAVQIGDRVQIQEGTILACGTIVEEDVEIGPRVVFASTPSRGKACSSTQKAHICKGVSIGANATLLPVTVGPYATVEPGATVINDVPANAIVAGNPARITGYTDAKGLIQPSSVLCNDKTGGAEGKLARIYNIPHFSDMRGDLCVLELEKFLPFPVKRIFYVFNVGSHEVRGEHAHKVCQQFLIALKGTVNVVVDNGKEREEVILNTPTKGVHLPAGCWGTQYKHSDDCLLLVCASHPYMADDYIRDYGEYLKYLDSLHSTH